MRTLARDVLTLAHTPLTITKIPFQVTPRFSGGARVGSFTHSERADGPFNCAARS